VFKALNLQGCSVVDPSNLLESFESDGPLKAAEGGFLVNDLEDPAFECSPALLALKREISTQMGTEGASGVMMSGSGTSIYALIRQMKGEDSVPKAVEKVLSAFPTVRHFKCEFLNKKDDLESWY
jgi:4-diphosphocytidyl-2C-methyl-D-erythritol kinase